MGIERFLTRIKDAGLGARRNLGCSGSEQHTKAIIDGPSLAYYIYGKLDDREEADGSIAPKITYKAVAKSTVEWLDKLQSYGFDIEAIFFDGALPASKKPTRIQRLTKHTEHLITYQHVHDEQYRQITHERLPVKSWDNPRMNRARKDKAPPAFLVAAVVDVLLRSRYADSCFVVPDEADRYCVAATQHPCSNHSTVGVSIFTNDSDLIIFDVGRKTAIVMLRDLSEQASDTEEHTSLSGVEYRPYEIMDKYNLTSLEEVAFLMKLDRAITFAEAVRSKDHASSCSGFNAFAQEYHVDHRDMDRPIPCTDPHQQALANGFDARLSELVHQLTVKAGDKQLKCADMYLPFLLENPSAASAWRIGAYWRATAYQMLLMGHGCTSVSILEYKRHSVRIVGTQVDLPDIADSGLVEAQRWLNAALIDDDCLTSVERWRFLIMEMTTTDMEHQGIAGTPMVDNIMTVLGGRPSSNWEVIHLSARYQAMYYSMRMCWQALRYIVSAPSQDLPSGSHCLLRTLSTLPSICDFFEPVLDVTKPVDAAEWDAVSEKYRNVQAPFSRKEEAKDDGMDIEEADGENTISPDESGEHENHGSLLAGNPFAALAQD